LVVNAYAPLVKRVYPSCSSVISSRRAVGRGSAVRTATSLTVSSIAVGPKHLMTSRPRASASTKSLLPLRLLVVLLSATTHPFRSTSKANVP
jgi:hypothetical protein